MAAKERAGAQVNTNASQRNSRQSKHDTWNYNFGKMQQQTGQLQQVWFQLVEEKKLQISCRKQRNLHSVIRILVPQIAHKAMACGVPTLEVTTSKLHDSSRG